MNLERGLLVRMAALLALCAGLGTAVADDDGVIKYRQGVMKAQGGYMGAMGMVVQGRADFSAHMVDHAQGLHRLTGKIADLFPPGSDFGETDALADIWDNPEDFNAKSKDTEQATANLVKAAQSGDRGEILKAYQAVGKSCKACHEEYRRKN